MRTLELQGPDAELRVAGIVDTTPGRVGVALHRMAAFARAQASR